jgi:hypothetical protein
MSKQLGGSSDYISTFYAAGAVGGPAAVSRATLRGIDNAPMFNPLSAKAVIPTLPATGIVPSGLYFSSMTGGSPFQMGGAEEVEMKSPPAPKDMPKDAVAEPKPKAPAAKSALNKPSRPCKWNDLYCNNCNGDYKTCPKLHELHQFHEVKN